LLDALSTEAILSEVFAERRSQHEDYSEQNHTAPFWLSILGEEFGEVCRAVYENDGVNYREELIQLAAVAVQMVEAYDRSRAPSGYFQQGSNFGPPLMSEVAQED
jgi:NTP pyrophosphatase (non-canonical NTP hydrolase)